MKNLLEKYYTVCLLLLPLLSFSQRIDNTAAFRDLKSNNYFRFHYDNDYFTATDHYYTQGGNFELASPKLIKNPINNLFKKLKNSEQKYGLSIELMGFAPTSLKSDKILYGDRPFSAAIMLKSFLISTDTIHKTKLSSALSIGIIGPGALGKEMQTKFHEWIHDEIPHGWQYQIKNDILLNYEIAHEKQLYKFHNLLALNSNAKLRLGTVNTNISGGLTTTLGKINFPFTSVKNKNDFQIYGYLQGLVSIIGYDTSLQGGLFNRKSPYVIANSDIDRFTFQTNYGIIIQYKALYLEYSRSELSREFKTGDPHKWGGIRIGHKL
ncbi:lipid A deacylase LpxR family protein [Flavobacterium ranwuense]|uniref:Lipid A deacylase LpxR family protein n=1 Tax=Flavobacterium ranwuense TaxID=2541725 RepID=A0ABY2DW22_9FLAO|nr:lipid A deacylase LpxR family protein [Flavobacterium ranwuense]TDE30335.1 lipid A deacylase LpxR family protein [Flavobacterium ranwuense]